MEARESDIKTDRERSENIELREWQKFRRKQTQNIPRREIEIRPERAVGRPDSEAYPGAWPQPRQTPVALPNMYHLVNVGARSSSSPGHRLVAACLAIRAHRGRRPSRAGVCNAVRDGHQL